MDGTTAIFTIIVTGLAAAVATLLVQNFTAVDLRREHHEVGSTIFLQLGVVFAVLLAFVFSEAWGEYNQALAAIDLEVSALHGAAMIAGTLPAPMAKEILGDELSYLTSVVHDEWPVMAARRSENLATDKRLQTLIQAVANLKLQGTASEDKKPEILSLLTQAHTEREMRIYQADSGIPGVLWMVLLGFDLILVGFVVFSSLRRRASAVLVSALFASALSSILVVARLLDFPFEGALALSPRDFVEVIGKVAHLLT